MVGQDGYFMFGWDTPSQCSQLRISKQSPTVSLSRMIAQEAPYYINLVEALVVLLLEEADEDEAKDR